MEDAAAIDSAAALIDKDKQRAEFLKSVLAPLREQCVHTCRPVLYVRSSMLYCERTIRRYYHYYRFGFHRGIKKNCVIMREACVGNEVPNLEIYANMRNPRCRTGDAERDLFFFCYTYTWCRF